MRQSDDVSGATSTVLHVFALCAFAIAQPLYGLLASEAEFFVARRSEPIDLVLFVVFLSVLVPAAIAAVAIGMGLLGSAARRGAYAVCVTLLSACVVLPILDRNTPLPGVASAVLALALGGGFVFVLSRVAALRSFLSLLSGASLVFPALFLFLSPAASLVMPRGLQLSAMQVDSRTPVVVILLDCLPVTALMTPEQEIDAAAYPNFASLAERSTWYRNATTVAVSTEAAVPALLTGRYPRGETLPIVSHHPDNLFTWLGASRPITAQESTSLLCPDSLCKRKPMPLEERLANLGSDTFIVYQHILVPDDWSRDLPQIGTDWHGFGGREASSSRTPEEIEAQAKRMRIQPDLRRKLWGAGSAGRVGRIYSWLNGLREQPQHSLFYLHLYLPHGPFRFLPTGHAYVPPGSELLHGFHVGNVGRAPLYDRLGERRFPWGRAWNAREELVVLGSQRMLMHVGFADRIMGRIMQALEDNGLWDPALVIVTSDHGESYNPSEVIRSRSDGNTAHVPLFIKLPGQQGGAVDERNAEIIDVFPTIVDVLGTESPWAMDGASLVSADIGRPTKRMYGAGDDFVERVWPDTGLADALARLADLVGTDRTTEAVLRRGPRQDLLGRASDELGLELLGAKFAQQALLRNVDPASNIVPAYLTGRISQPSVTPGPIDLAVAVNGVVRATTRSIYSAGKNGFAVLVPETAYQAGVNRVELFEIPETPADGAQ